jgi:hypothetical protein
MDNPVQFGPHVSLALLMHHAAVVCFAQGPGAYGVTGETLSALSSFPAVAGGDMGKSERFPDVRRGCRW